jgi:hypothetical protein
MLARRAVERRRPGEVMRARPVKGEINHVELTREIIRRFPKVLAELCQMSRDGCPTVKKRSSPSPCDFWQASPTHTVRTREQAHLLYRHGPIPQCNGYDLAIDDTVEWAARIIALVEHRTSEKDLVHALWPFAVER